MDTDPNLFFAQLTAEASGLTLTQLDELCGVVAEEQFTTNADYRVAVHAAARTAIEVATGAPASIMAVRVAAGHVLSVYR